MPSQHQFGGETPFKTRKKPVPDPISQETLYNLGKTAGSHQDTALFFFLYLTGARITEALQVRCDEISLDTKPLPSGKKVKCITIRILTLKHRKGIPRRTIPVNLIGLDLKMFQEINKLRATRAKGDDYLFDYGDIQSGKARWKAYHHIKKITYSIRGIAPPDGRVVVMADFGINLHYLRHCRATHLSTTYGYKEHELMLFFGWATIAPGTTYVNLNPTELLSRIVEHDGGAQA
jgi:integrase